jgi:hypothetical protein
VNPIDVQRYLAGADYPTDGSALAELAGGSGAPAELCDALEQVGDVDGPDDVMRELAGVLPMSGSQ